MLYPTVPRYQPLAISVLKKGQQEKDHQSNSLIDSPKAMNCKLFSHQVKGLMWMKKIEESFNKGGILADSMGLGKTIQTLALIASTRSQNEEKRTTLIIVSLSIIDQWNTEFNQKFNNGDHALKTFTLYTRNTQTFAQLKKFDVVLTTYGILTAEYKHKTQNSSRTKARLSLLGDECRWYR